MADTIDRIRRSQNMAKIKGRDTQPEMRLRSALHRLGLRLRVCRKDLPGKPDIVLPRHRIAIQVRGCFWHQHDCGGGRLPKSNLDYWKPKLTRNVERDKVNDTALAEIGWKVRVVWERDLKGAKALQDVAEGILRETRSG